MPLQSMGSLGPINQKMNRTPNGDYSALNLVDPNGNLIDVLPTKNDNLDDYRCGFEASVANGVNTVKAKLLKTGSGMTINQTNGKLVITTGTNVKSETAIRLQDNSLDKIFNVPFNFRSALMLSARNPNQSFIFEMVDIIGDNLAYTATSATNIIVNIPNHNFDAVKDIGKKLTIGVFNDDIQPSQDITITSIAGANVTFTGAGFTAQGGNCSLFGLNSVYMIYDGNVATSYKIGSRRNGRDFVAGGSPMTSGTTAQMLTDYVYVEKNSISFADKPSAIAVNNNKQTRGCYESAIPDPSVNLVCQIRVLNGTTAPAAATLTVDFISILNAKDPVGVNIFASENGGASPVEAKMTQSSETIGAVNINAGSNLIGKVNIEPAPTVYADTVTNLASSATFTGTSRDAGATIAMHKFVSAIFTDQAGTAYHDMSLDGVTWRAQKMVAIVANTPVEIETNVVARYNRLRLINGATAQTALMINSAYRKL